MVSVVLLWARVLVVFLKGVDGCFGGCARARVGLQVCSVRRRGRGSWVRRCIANPSHDDDDDDSDSDASCVMRLDHPCRRHRYRLEVESASAPAGDGVFLVRGIR